jgi:hypothetical protein
MDAPAIIRSERSLTARDRLLIAEDPGKPTRRVTGGYIDDLAALGKAVQLCGGVMMTATGFEVRKGSCAAKFNHGAYGYSVRDNLPMVSGKCDGCGQHHDRNVMFLPKNRNFL